MHGQKEYLVYLISKHGHDWNRLKAEMERGDKTYASAVVNCWRRRGI
jgi:hypothetical protein